MERLTLGSCSFLSKSWFRTSTHSANLLDWKCKAASLASAAAADKTASSSVPEDPSRFALAAAVDDDDEDKSRASISNGSTNRRLIFYEYLIQMSLI